MKRTRYTKFIGSLADDINLDDLMQALSDFLLDSGFHDPFSRFQELDGDHNFDNLREAIRQALEDGSVFDAETQEKYEAMSDDEREQLIDELVDRLREGNYIQPDQPDQSSVADAAGQGDIAQPNPPEGAARFNVTDKGMDFLSYRSLRDLLGGMGRANRAGTTPASRRRAWNPVDQASRTNSAIPSTST